MSFQKKRIPKHLIIHDRIQPATRMNFSWIILAATLILVSVFTSLKAQAYSLVNERNAKTFAADLTFTSPNSTKKSSLHLSSDARVEIHGMLVRVTLTQRFRNDSEDFQQGLYTLPLSETAAVTGMSMKIGERLIVGEIKEKSEAKKIYHEAVNSGKKAALTEQHRPNLFTQKIANIAPDETIDVNITYIERATFKHGAFSWRLPTTLTPRYYPALHGMKETTSNTESNNNKGLEETIDINDLFNSKGFMFGNDFPSEEFIEKTTDKTQNTFALDIKLNSGLSLAHIDALYHDLHINKKNGEHLIALANQRELMDRDFVLQWSPTQSATPNIAAYTESINGEHFTSLMIVPPVKVSIEEQNNSSKIRADRIFIIDTSGSMSGTSIQQARNSLKKAINDLDEHHNFNIIEFNSRFTKLYQSPQRADKQTKDEALRWIDNLRANGGTNILPALKEAIKNISNSTDETLKQIIFITDGSVGNEPELFTLIYEKLNDIRLFTIGIGSAPNSFFMRKAAQFGRGTFTYISDLNEVQEKMTQLLKQVNSVAVKNIQLELPKNFKSNIEQYPKKTGDLYYGEPLIISMKSSNPLHELSISGQTGKTNWNRKLNLTHALSSPSSDIGSLWARDKIESLEDEKITRLRNEEDIKNDIIEIALRHKLASRHTSFVAVEQEISRPKEASLKNTHVANLHPKGQLHKVAYPRTATTAEISWWLGLFSIMVLIIFRRLSDEEQNDEE